MSSSISVSIINNSHHPLPEYKTNGSSGMDIRAFLQMPIEIKPLERVIIPTGLMIELPLGFEAQIRPRSGLAINEGITVINAPGTIDSDYRGEIKIGLVNLSDTTKTINDGDRIAQMIIAKYEIVEWNLVDQLQETNRGIGGFGSTGIS